MYLKRICFTPERLSAISDEEQGRLYAKNFLNKTKQIQKLREIAEKFTLTIMAKSLKILVN